MDTKRPKEHELLEERLNSAISRIQVEVMLSRIGKSQVEEAMKRGVKGPELAEVARKAHRSGWIPAGHVFGRDARGCIRRVEMRFVKHESGAVRTLSRMLSTTPDGRVKEAE